MYHPWLIIQGLFIPCYPLLTLGSIQSQAIMSSWNCKGELFFSSGYGQNSRWFQPCLMDNYRTSSNLSATYWESSFCYFCVVADSCWWCSLFCWCCGPKWPSLRCEPLWSSETELLPGCAGHLEYPRISYNLSDYFHSIQLSIWTDGQGRWLWSVSSPISFWRPCDATPRSFFN